MLASFEVHLAGHEADLVTSLAALCLNNQDAKDEVRDLWAIPLLVSLLSKASRLPASMLAKAHHGSKVCVKSCCSRDAYILASECLALQ